MTLNYAQYVINQRLNDVVTDIDAASPIPGKIRLLDSSNQTMGLVVLSIPCGTVGAGVLTFTTPVSAPLITIGGQIVAARVEDGNGTTVASGLTVGPSTGYDIYMSSVVVSTGQIVTLTYATITGR